MVNEVSVPLYAIQRFYDGVYDSGFPFAAIDDFNAKQMVIRSFEELKDRKDLDFTAFSLVRVGTWYPARANPLMRKAVVFVCNVNDLFKCDGGDLNAEKDF